MRRRSAAARAWYGGRTPPSADVLAAAEEIDPKPRILYDHAGGQEGDYAAAVRGLYDRMDSLKRNPNEFRTWTEEDGMEAFFEVLMDLAPQELRGRVQALQRLGAFKFRKVDGPEEKKAKIEGVFAPGPGDENYAAQLRSQAKRLAAIWAPKADSLLDFIANRPAQIGRVLADRLSPGSARPVRFIGHAFTEVRSTLLRPLAETKTVAYERDAEVHVLTAVQPVLEKWDEDASTGGCAQFKLLDALLLHELVELAIDETEEGLEPMEGHIVATTFERYLKGAMLQVAVEDFFLEWPPLSSEEIAERRHDELAQQVEEMSAFMGEGEMPLEDDEDLDSLPLDTDQSPLKKKLKKAVRTKPGAKKSAGGGPGIKGK